MSIAIEDFYQFATQPMTIEEYRERQKQVAGLLNCGPKLDIRNEFKPAACFKALNGARRGKIT